jgi:hypothetical protein
VYQLAQQLLSSRDEYEESNVKLQYFESEELVTRTVAVTIAVGSFVRRKLYFAWEVVETCAEVRDTKVQELYGINQYIFQNMHSCYMMSAENICFWWSLFLFCLYFLKINVHNYTRAVNVEY